MSDAPRAAHGEAAPAPGGRYLALALIGAGALVAVLADFGLAPSGASPRYAARAAQPAERAPAEARSEPVERALDQLARTGAAGDVAHFQHADSSAFVLVEHAGPSFRVRVSAYALDPPSHARLAALWARRGRAIEPLREPEGEPVFYELELPADPHGGARAVGEVFREVFELPADFELFVEFW